MLLAIFIQPSYSPHESCLSGPKKGWPKRFKSVTGTGYIPIAYLPSVPTGLLCESYFWLTLGTNGREHHNSFGLDHASAISIFLGSCWPSTLTTPILARLFGELPTASGPYGLLGYLTRQLPGPGESAV